MYNLIFESRKINVCATVHIEVKLAIFFFKKEKNTTFIHAYLIERIRLGLRLGLNVRV